MKKITILVLGSLISTSLFSQKVDLDKSKFEVRFQVLPVENVPLDKRTFQVTSTLGPSVKSYVDENVLNQKININGWKKTADNPTVTINLDLIDFSLISSKLQEEVNENKDKSGKVISRTAQYFINAEYRQDGRIKISGPFSPKELTLKEIDAQKQKEEKVATNRFLAKTNLNAQAKSDADFKVENLPSSRRYSTDKYETSSKAVDFFKASQSSISDKLLRAFVDESARRSTDLGNYYFGFRPVAETEYLWIVDTKSHPEYQAQQDAAQAVKMLFAEMKADEPIDALRENLEPIIEYFESIKSKYKTDEKADKKLRYGAFYNLSKLYYYLDKPDLAIIQAEGLIENDYDKKDGEKLVENAQILVDIFKKTKLNSTHNSPLK